MSKIGITIITDIDELLVKVNDFADHILENYFSKKVADLPHLLNALKEWEEKNKPLLSAYEYENFYLVKKRIENLMNEFQLSE